MQQSCSFFFYNVFHGSLTTSIVYRHICRINHTHCILSLKKKIFKSINVNKNLLIMVSLAGQIIFLKVRRIFELLIFIIIIYIIYSRWSSKGNVVDQSHEKSSKKENNGRPDLAKYIHIDLKGAPPKANQFYESFFEFLEKLQMGIKGVLIEYEDTLPLQGNLINVSIRKQGSNS